MRVPASGFWPPLALALGGAFAWAGCHGAAPRPWLAALSLVPLVLLMERADGGRWAWLHGTVTWLVAIPWIVPTLVRFGNLPTALSWFLLTLLAAYLGAYQGLFVRLGRPLWRAGGWRLFLALPALWVALEAVRGVLFGGFPWNLAGYAWAAAPGALPLTAWTGTEGVSFLLLAVNVAVARSLLTRRFEPATTVVLAVLVVLPAAGRWSLPREAGRGSVEARIVQPDTGILDPSRDDLAAAYRATLAMTAEACREGREPGRPGRLVVLPESAFWPLSWDSSPPLRRDLHALAAEGCEIVLNGIAVDGERIFNTAYAIGTGGVLGRYDKRRLVPWGETVPLGDLLPFVGHLARNAGSFAAGGPAHLLPWGREELGVVICYEVTYAGETASRVRQGATVLLTMTNDAWYGDSSAPHQHFRAARFRAAEARRPLLRAALTGISGLIDARGRVVAELGVGERGTLRAEVAGLDGLSPYVRAPWLPSGLAGLLALFAIVGGRRLRRPSSSRSSLPAASDPTPSPLA